MCKRNWLYAACPVSSHTTHQQLKTPVKTPLLICKNISIFLMLTGYKSKNKLYQVQLGEEIDSKLLLGSYKCTDVPGEFVWQPGILTKVAYFSELRSLSYYLKFW